MIIPHEELSNRPLRLSLTDASWCRQLVPQRLKITLSVRVQREAKVELTGGYKNEEPKCD
jgi:hypothetical protein